MNDSSEKGSLMRHIRPPELFNSPAYTHVVETTARRTLYVSGQVAFDGEGKVVGVGDMAAQTRQTMENLKAALAAAGATLDNVVKMTTFIVDMSQVQAMRDVRREYFPNEPRPASTAVGVTALVMPELLIEIEAVAVLD